MDTSGGTPGWFVLAALFLAAGAANGPAVRRATRDRQRRPAGGRPVTSTAGAGADAAEAEASAGAEAAPARS